MLDLRIKIELEPSQPQPEAPELQDEETVFCKFPMCQQTDSFEVKDACQRNCIRRKQRELAAQQLGIGYAGRAPQAPVTGTRPAATPIQIGP